MKKLLPACIAATLMLSSVWAQDGALVAAPTATTATTNGAAPEAVAKDTKKEAEKRTKPKPTKKSRKPAPRSSNP